VPSPKLIGRPAAGARLQPRSPQDSGLRTQDYDSTQDYEGFVCAVRDRAGIDLAGYRVEQMERRLRGFLKQAKVERFADYLELLDRDPEQLRRFRGSLSITVSEFFRSPDRFAELRDSILPRLLSARPTLRVWSAGCSYGAEAYSLALLLADLAPDQDHYLLATDVDETVLTRARAGRFSERDLQHVPAAMRQRCFSPSGSAIDEVRAKITFKRHDLLTEEYESNFDLIVCRNVMMYFSTAAKGRIAGLLYHALRAGGYLFTGSTEAMAQLPVAGFARESVGFYRREESHARS